MSTTGLKAFDSTLQSTNGWLHELMEELHWPERERAYHALRAVLHALRDRLPVGEVAALAAQLPLLLRGVYYEGWRPLEKHHRGHRLDDFLAEVGAAFPGDRDVDPEFVARTVFRVLEWHVSPGEVEGIRHVLPHELRTLLS